MKYYPTLPAAMLLSEEEIQNLVSEGTLLGVGSSGQAFRTRYKGKDVVAKVAHSKKRARLFEGEVRTMLALDGLGGAPRVLAAC